MARMLRDSGWWDGKPPTSEDYEAYDKVRAWTRRWLHRLAMDERRYTLTFSSDEGPWIETEYDREPLTDELAEALGISVINERNQ